MALLEVKNLRTSFHTRHGVVRAVQDVSFSLGKGETLGIVGESGSGKSVTCSSVMRLIPEPPGRREGGQAFFDGVDLLSCPERTLRSIRGKRIGMVFQDPMTSLNPYLRIEEQLIEPLRLHEGLERNQAVDLFDHHNSMPAPVQRRHAATGDDRDGPHHPPRVAHRR